MFSTKYSDLLIDMSLSFYDKVMFIFYDRHKKIKRRDFFKKSPDVFQRSRLLVQNVWNDRFIIVRLISFY